MGVRQDRPAESPEVLYQEEFNRSLPVRSRAIRLPPAHFASDGDLYAEYVRDELNRDGSLRDKPRPSLWRQWVMAKGEAWLPRCAMVAQMMGDSGRAEVWQLRVSAFEDQRIDWFWPLLRTGEVWWRPVGDGTQIEYFVGDWYGWPVRDSLRRRKLTQRDWVFDVEGYVRRVNERPAEPKLTLMRALIDGARLAWRKQRRLMCQKFRKWSRWRPATFTR